MEKHPTSFFWKKKKIANKITLEDSEKNILSDDTLVSEELKKFFQNAIKTLNINENSYIVDSSSSITNPVDEAKNVGHFSFKEASISETEKELRELNSNEGPRLVIYQLKF